MIHLSNCPACKNESEISHFSICTDYFKSGEVFDIMKCNNCGILFTNPVPELDETSYYYDSDEYFSHKDKSKGLTGKLYLLLRKIAIRRKYKLVNRYKQKGIILDYGCGTGELAAYFSSNGWNAYGYEPGASATELLQEKQSVQIIQKDNFQAFKGYFDVIMLWHVLEHVSDLYQTINWLRTALKDDGVLIIAVPNYRSRDAGIYKQYWAAWDVPRHLYHFDRDSLIHLFQRFDLDCFEHHALKMDAYYISLISEKYKYGHSNYFKALSNGFLSNRAGSRRNKNYSSILEVFIKK